MIEKIHINCDVEVKIYKYNTVIVGAGAAGMNCAVKLWEFMTTKGIKNPEEKITVVTAGLPLGASRMSGSDKQTYYKMGTSPTVADSAFDFAQTLTAFGCCHGDVALAEGISSLRGFYHLVETGVPFPHNPEGAFIGYKTDHDPYERATSAGPKTSKFMSECLQRKVEFYRIRIFDHQELAHIITDGTGKDKRIKGIITLDKKNINNPALGLTVFCCENIVFAAGGPGELYEVSVYPPMQTGIHGLALKAGLKAHNLTESQFGLASTKFRWNVSGTYMQVIPRIFSTDKYGNNEKEFLAPYFDTTSKMATNIFLKGYQWPFDAQRVLNQQSSLIDILVYYETQILERRVFMDFTQNPVAGNGKEPFDINKIDEEAFTYLEKNNALQPTPIERLEFMNPLAIDIYSENGINIKTEPLEINVCAQHNNGGFYVDKWWQSNIPHTFVIGEMAGTHGVKRPGGSALNAGQVGAMRAAEYIVNVYDSEKLPDIDLSLIEDNLLSTYEKLANWQKSSNGITPEQAISQIQKNMSKYGSYIRQLETSEVALENATELVKRIKKEGISINKNSEIPKAIQAEHLAITQIAFLESIIEYLKQGGGSRGSFMVLRDDGTIIHDNLINPVTNNPISFIEENLSLRETIAEIILESENDMRFKINRVPVRPIPTRDEAFELAWTSYRNGEVYLK